MEVIVELPADAERWSGQGRPQQCGVQPKPAMTQKSIESVF